MSAGRFRGPEMSDDRRALTASRVIVSGLSANWDPAAFTDPTELDIERGARHHLAEMRRFTADTGL